MSRQAVTEVTALEETFCLEYAKTRRLADSYRLAFDPEPTTPVQTLNRYARELLDRPRIKRRVMDLIEAAAAPTIMTVQEVMGLFCSIALADPNELISLKVGCCRYCWGEGHAYQWREREYLEELAKAERSTKADVALPDYGGGFGFNATRDPHQDCPECHGEGLSRIVARDTDNLSPAGRLLFGGVKHTNSGPQIIMADRFKALENVARILGAFNDKVDVRVQGAIQHAIEVVDVATLDPAEAAKRYQDFIGANNR